MKAMTKSEKGVKKAKRSGGKEEGRLSEAEAGVEEAKKAEREKSPAFAGGRKTERME